MRFASDVSVVSDVTLAEKLGLPRGVVVNYCKRGRFLGAWCHPLTRRWWIPLPVHVVPFDRHAFDRH